MQCLTLTMAVPAVLLLATSPQVSAGPKVNKAMIKMISYNNLISDCIGEEANRKFTFYVRANIKTCMQEPVSLEVLVPTRI